MPKKQRTIHHVSGGTLGYLFRYLIPQKPKGGIANLDAWAPDVFAIAGYVLHKTGTYHHALNTAIWRKRKRKEYAKLQDIGRLWRTRMERQQNAPKEVRNLWKAVINRDKLSIHEVGNDHDLVMALLDLVGCADAACEGLGLPASPNTQADLIASNLLTSSHLDTGASTLCQYVTPISLCVLPKLHTPQVGMTIRSLTHHLALWPRDELCPVWAADLLTGLTTREEGGLNVLLVPYPYEIDVGQFSSPDVKQCGRHEMVDGFRFMQYNPKSARRWLKDKFPGLLQNAREKAPGKRLDAVVFPELSFSSPVEIELAAKALLEVNPHAFLVAGASTKQGNKHVNTAQFVIPITKLGENELSVAWYKQDKHHRWQLDGWQINQYGLQKQLPPGKRYWEDTAFGQRSIYCFPLKRSLTLSVLICEDLARQEPAARLIRAVAPNLVIALLMDGEQEPRRWSGRYASVLGEDPGSSVLTLTSRGMIELQRRATEKSASRKKPIGMCVGLWRDCLSTSARELRMDESSDALLLCLESSHRLEYSVDGRSYNASVLRLPDGPDAVKQVSLD